MRANSHLHQRSRELIARFLSFPCHLSAPPPPGLACAVPTPVFTTPLPPYESRPQKSRPCLPLAHSTTASRIPHRALLKNFPLLQPTGPGRRQRQRLHESRGPPTLVRRALLPGPALDCGRRATEELRDTDGGDREDDRTRAKRCAGTSMARELLTRCVC